MFIQRDDYKTFFKEIKRLDEESGRHYDVEGVPLPSVTTVISFMNRDRIAKWRARVGEKAAAAIGGYMVCRDRWRRAAMPNFRNPPLW